MYVSKLEYIYLVQKSTIIVYILDMEYISSPEKVVLG